MQLASFQKMLGLFILTGLSTVSSYATDTDHEVFGSIEKALITEYKIKVSVRMDTGAKTSSLGASNIKIIQKDGKDWVSFTYDHPSSKEHYQLMRPLIRYVAIRKRQGELNEKEKENIAKNETYERRPVVTIPVCLGNQTHMVEVSLTNRAHFNYPMLMGRTAMEQFGILIDPARTFTAKPQCSPPN